MLIFPIDPRALLVYRAAERAVVGRSRPIRPPHPLLAARSACRRDRVVASTAEGS